jgi:Tfp pilus assembly protein PilF
MNPGLLLSHVELARIYAGTGDSAKARRHYEAALRLAPADPVLQEEAKRFFSTGAGPEKAK